MRAQPYYDDGQIQIWHARCEDVLPTLADKSVDVVLADPPYSQHVHGKSRRGGSLPDAGAFSACIRRSRELGFDSITPELMEVVARETARIVRRWAMFFSDVELTADWRSALTAAGLDYVRTGAWIKEGATPQFTGDRPAAGFEAITIVHPKGRKRWNGGGAHAVWSEPIVLNRGNQKVRVHTTQKPIDLIRKLIALFSDPGELIIDPFMGSGTTLRAAKDLGRRAIGIDMVEENCRIAVNRMQQAVLPMEAA